MSDRRVGREHVAAGLAVGAFAGSLLIYAIAARLHPSQMWFMLDLRVYRLGGLAARHGSGLYRLRYPLLPFTYSPFAALVFELLSLFGIDELRFLITVSSIVAMAGTIWLTVRASAPAWTASRRLRITLFVSAVALWLEPVQQTLHFGQVNLLLMVIVMADLLQPDDRRWKGLGVGIAAGFKLTPLIFLAYLLVTRRLRAAVTGVAAVLGTVLLGAIALPTESRQFWIHHLFLDSQRVGGLANLPNQSLQGVLARLAHGVDAAAWYWRPLDVVVAVVGLTLAAWAHRRSNEINGVLVCAVTGLLVSPVSWSHHWVYAAPALAVGVVFALAHRHRLAWLLTGGGVLLMAAWPVPHRPGGPIVPHGLIWLMPSYHHREFGWHGLQLIVGNVEFLVGLSALVGTWLVLRRRPAP